MKKIPGAGIFSIKAAIILAAAILITAIASPYLVKQMEKAESRNRIAQYRNSPDYLLHLETMWEWRYCENIRHVIDQIEIDTEHGLESPDVEKLKLYNLVHRACLERSKTPQ